MRRARGVRVVVLEIRRSRELLAETGGVVGRWRSQLYQALTGWPEIEVISDSEAHPVDHFCDYSHFNRRGRDRFMSWFVPQINALLREDGV